MSRIEHLTAALGDALGDKLTGVGSGRGDETAVVRARDLTAVATILRGAPEIASGDVDR